LEANLTQGKNGFVGMLGASEDLSRIYYVDTAVLAAGAQEDQDNLYLWENGTVRFVVVLAGGGNTYVPKGFYVTDWAASVSDRTAQVTPNGEYVAFMSNAPLTGYDSECRKNFLGAQCFEVFEFDARSDRVVCVSCDPAGERPLGYSSLGLSLPARGVLQQPNDLADDGRLFFDSQDSLSPFDKNDGHEDVYEYEPVGTGSCTSGDATPGVEGLTGAGGCVALISGGQEDVDSSLVDVNPSGSDVFFVTRSRLVPEDQDELLDLYDAREPHTPGEPVGAPEAVTSTECASSTECREGSSGGGSSGLQGPSSETLSGAKNLPSPPAPKPAGAVQGTHVKGKPLTRAQKLTRALSLCRKQHKQKSASKARKTCEAKAHKRYGAKTVSARKNGKAHR
jgi:hypothetical protein